MHVESLLAEDSVSIRAENSTNFEERAAIRTIHEIAFGGPYEAELVDKLRADEHAIFSLVAVLESEVVGHIMFSRMFIRTETEMLPTVALAPVAVLPEHQRKGIGARLIRHGLDLLRDKRENIVIVVGHPSYYPRFGFSSEKTRSIESPFPADAFMAIELNASTLEDIVGSVVYPDAFGI